MKAMETIQDLIEEAKVRSVWWGLCIFSVTYFLTHTSTSMWMNLPIAILIVCGLRMLSNEVDFHWKARSAPQQSHLSYLKKKQLSLKDSRFSRALPLPRWKKKIDSPVVESAINDFIDKILKDFVVDLWYSEITPDREAPELIRAVILDALGEISVRVKEINIVDLVTRDIVDLIGDHLEIFRRNQAAIGVDVMKTLSSEERDERLKFHLMVSGELYPALISPESEYKVLQKIVAGILAVVLRPREAQCPLVRAIAREIVTCLVLQPLLNLACPERINEVIEIIINIIKEGNFKQSVVKAESVGSASLNGASIDNQVKDKSFAEVVEQKTPSRDYEDPQSTIHPQPAEWARKLEAATQRRTEVLAPENLENMWTKGRNYKKKEYKKSVRKDSLAGNTKGTKPKDITSMTGSSTRSKDKAVARLPPRPSDDDQLHEGRVEIAEDFVKSSSFEGKSCIYEDDPASVESKSGIKRSSSMSDLKWHPETSQALVRSDEGPIIADFFTTDLVKHSEKSSSDKPTEIVLHNQGQQGPKLKCRVLGAYFEKLGSKSFAVYSIAVTDIENKTWFVKRRYSNFEWLHRQLKDIPNYNLHLPPKRIFSSSTEDAFVHQRCIQLDRYLQDLLSIANVAEQHEVWDFLSAASKKYSFGKSASVMRTLAVNVDDAMDDIVRQFKGVSGGLMRKVAGPTFEENAPGPTRHLSLSIQDLSSFPKQTTSESLNSTSDNDDVDKLGDSIQAESRSNSEGHEWHSDNELNSKSFPQHVVRRLGGLEKSVSEQRGSIDLQLADPLTALIHNPTGMPPEWTPPNVSVPILNLVDKVFQLKRRGWLRRQVFWISKQILQLVMEDAVDDWLLRQICWLRKEDTIAKGIHWAQDILWPNGIFFTRVSDCQTKSGESNGDQKASQISGQFSGLKSGKPISFEQQLEASRRAKEIEKFLYDGAPTALVGLVGHNQYKRCARDIFYFTQSNVCIKQVVYSVLELLLKSIFPELEDVLRDVRETMQSGSL